LVVPCSLLQTITFNVTVLPAVETVLRTSGGVTAELVTEVQYAVPLPGMVVPGAMWSNPALFIDQNRAELGHIGGGRRDDRRNDRNDHHDGRGDGREGPQTAFGG
jgi:hypothetical protein